MRPHHPQSLAKFEVCYDDRFMAEYSIGLDLGGTNLRARRHRPLGQGPRKDRRQHHRGRRQRGAARRNGRGDQQAESRNWGAGGLAGIGVGVPGFILLKEGVITNSNNLPFLERLADPRRNGSAAAAPA